MSYELTLEQFENLNLFSNRNMEKVLTNIVNSSSNAALVNMGEDSVILLDHKEGKFYIADYEFDREKLTVEFSHFDSIDLIEEGTEFESEVSKVFESDEFDLSVLTESYKKNVVEKDSFINELVSFTMSRKNYTEDVDYDDIAEAVSSVKLNSLDRQFFNEYKDRMDDYPLNEVKRFNWVNPVKVSLVETEKEKIVNKSAIQKAHDLWKRDSFKAFFNEATENLIEDIDEGKEKFSELFEEFPQLFFLDEADRKTLFGKAILNSSAYVRESMDDILKGIDILFEQEFESKRQEYLAEYEDVSVSDIDMEDEGMEDMEDDMDSYEPAPEVEVDDMSILIDDLEAIKNSCQDQKSVGKLEFLIDRLKKGIEEGTRPDIIKQAVSILSL